MSWESRAPCGNKLMVFITAVNPCHIQERLFTNHTAKNWDQPSSERAGSQCKIEKTSHSSAPLLAGHSREEIPSTLMQRAFVQARQGTANSLFWTMLALPRLQQHQQRAWSNNFPLDFFLEALQHSLSSIYVLGINRQVQNPIPHPRKERGWFILTSEN